MRVAAISDIHGDLRALRAVWVDIESRGLASGPVLNAGDTVAYGHDTMPCIDFVRDPDREIITVAGNYDVNTARFPVKQESFRRKWARLRPDKLQALSDASRDLTDGGRTWLGSLKAHVQLSLSGAEVSLSHYAPTTEKEGLFDDTSEDRLFAIGEQLGGRVDIVVVGHTHTPFARRAAGVLFVNPGCVGRSFGNPTYAEIHIEPNLMPEATIISCRVSQP